MNAAQVASYVGIPYKEGGLGPDAYNCWGLLIHIQREYFGVNVPLVPLGNVPECLGMFKSAIDDGEWTQVDKPNHGDVVILRSGSDPHVGVYVDVERGGILHALENIGVIFTPMTQLNMLGYGRCKFYRAKNAS